MLRAKICSVIDLGAMDGPPVIWVLQPCLAFVTLDYSAEAVHRTYRDDYPYPKLMSTWRPVNIDWYSQSTISHPFAPRRKC